MSEPCRSACTYIPRSLPHTTSASTSTHLELVLKAHVARRRLICRSVARWPRSWLVGALDSNLPIWWCADACLGMCQPFSFSVASLCSPYTRQPGRQSRNFCHQLGNLRCSAFAPRVGPNRRDDRELCERRTPIAAPTLSLDARLVATAGHLRRHGLS